MSLSSKLVETKYRILKYTVHHVFYFRVVHTLLKENMGKGWPKCLLDWDQSRVLMTNSVSGTSRITFNMKCSIPLQRDGNMQSPSRYNL